MYTWQPSKVHSKYGAPMGRASSSERDIREIVAEIHHGASPKMTLQRVRLNGGGYDDGGAYWGHDRFEQLWRASDESSNPTVDTIEVFVRAPSREAAKDAVRKLVPGARFFR